MQYMMLIYFEEQSLNDQDRQSCYLESAQYAQQLNAKGQYVAAGPLHPTSTATSIRTGSGKRVITDGPFAETREQLGGFFIVEAKNLDEAIEIASNIPAGRHGTVEIRPMIAVPTLPEKINPQPVDSVTAGTIH